MYTVLDMPCLYSVKSASLLCPGRRLQAFCKGTLVNHSSQPGKRSPTYELIVSISMTQKRIVTRVQVHRCVVLMQGD